jgi:cbb3-type cytochrome oxidase subunit 3
MISRLFENVPVNLWTQISVLIFLAIFIVIVLWTYSPANRCMYKKAGEIPLRGENHD